MKRRVVDQGEPEMGSDDPGRLDSFALKCTAIEKAILQGVMKSKNMSGVAFARLISFLLMRAGFRNPQAGEIPEIGALKSFLLQLIADCTDRVSATLDDLANQVSASNDKLAKAASEASAQQSQFETEMQKKDAELVNLRLKADGLARENSALIESVEKANKVAQLLERQNQEKAGEIAILKNQIEVAIGCRFGGLAEDLAEIKTKLGGPDSKTT